MPVPSRTPRFQSLHFQFPHPLAVFFGRLLVSLPLSRHVLPAALRALVLGLLLAAMGGWWAPAAQAQVPATPSIQAIPGNGQVKVQWAAISGATSYTIYQGPASGNVSIELGTQTATTGTNSYIRSGLANDTKYYFGVVAKNASGNSQMSSHVPATPVAPPVLATANVDNNKVMLSWSGVSGTGAAAAGVKGYEIYRGVTGGAWGTTPIHTITAPVTTPPTAPATTYTDLTAQNGTEYKYKVQVLNPDSNASLVSNSINAKPIAPATISGASPGNGAVILSITGLPVSASYTTYRSTDVNFAAANVTSLGNSTSTASGTGTVNALGLTNGTTYYFRVRPVTSGTGPYSNQLDATPLAVPVWVEANQESHRISLKWSWGGHDPTPTSPITYQVVRVLSTESFTANSPVIETVSGLTYDDEDVDNGTAYKYRIRVANPNPNPYLESAGRVATPMAVPDLTAQNVVPGVSKVDLNWDDISGSSGYRIYRSESTDPEDLGTSYSSASSSISISCTNGTTYYFRVQPRNGYGNGPLSARISARPMALPLTPTGLSAAGGNARVTLTWNNNTSNVNGANSYKLYRGTSPGQTATGTEILVAGSSNATITYVDNGRTNGTTYYYTVKAVNTSGTSAASGEVNAKAVAPPATPGVTLVNSTGQVTLNWNVAAGVDSYDVLRSSSSGGTYTPLQSNIDASGTTLSYTHSDLTDGSSYYYKVVANNAGGSTASAVLNGRPIAKPVLGIGAGSDVYLWWNAAPGATGYDVYRGTSPTDYANYTKIESDLTSFSCTSTGLTHGDTYYYRLAAKNSGGVVFSETVSAIPLMYPLSIPIVGSGQVTFNWAPAAGATSYEVRRGATYETAAIVQANGPSRTFTETGLINGTRYTYYIIARNASGASYLPIGIIPSASPMLRASGGANQVTLDWDAVSGATGYDLYRGTDPTDANSFVSLVTNQTGLGYTDLTAVNGTTYSYGLAIYDAGGVVFSNLASATPRALPAQPTGLSASAGNAQVTLSWNAAGDADSYKLYRSTTPAGSTTDLTVSGGGTANNYLDSGRTNGTTYYYTLKAFNTSGSSVASIQVDARPLAAPTAPTLSGGAPNGGIVLSWTTQSGQTYTLSRSETSGGPYTALAGATDLSVGSHTDATAMAGTTYYYVLTATNVGGTSPNSNRIAAKKLETPSLSLTGIGGGTASLAWTGVTGASGYEVFRSQNSSSFGSTAYATIAAPALVYTDLAASNGQTYYYKVRATAPSVNNSAGSLSSYVTASPLAAPVVTVTAGAGQVTLTWPAVTGATSYQVFQSTSSGVQGSLINAVSGTPVTGLDNGTTYYYQVRAINSTGTGPLSTQQSGTPRALPAKPTGLSASAGNAKVTLNWNAVADADSYTVYRSKTNGQTATGDQFTVAATSDPTVTYPNSGLDNGDTYYYTVQAFNTSGAGVASDQVSAKPLAAPSAAPTLFISTGDDSVTLSWTVVTGDNISYRVQRSTDGGTTYSTLNDVLTATSFSDPDVENGSTYDYRVYATNAGGDGPGSNVVSGTPLALPAKVGAVTLTPGDSQMGISFAAVPTASSYRIYQSTTAGTYDYNNTTKTVSGTGTISTSIDGLVNGTRYYYEVKAVNSTGAGAASDEVSAETLAKPGKPVLNAVAGDGQVDLNWNPVSGATSYTLKRGTDSGGPYGTTVSENIPATLGTPQTYQDNTVQNGTTYYYILTASNASGEGAASDQQLAKPQAAPTSAPQNLLITSDGLQVTLTWDGLTGADGYKIYRTTDLDAQDNPVFGTGAFATTAETSYEDNDVEHGVTYYYQVRGYNGIGQGPAAEGEITVYAHLGLDARIASGSVNDWVGEDIINNTGVNQTINASPAAGQTVKYRVQVNTTGGNSGNKSMYVTIPDWETNPLAGWTIHVFNNHTGGTDVTDAVFGTNQTTNVKGWLATVPNGQPLKFRIELTAPSTANVDDAKSLKVKIAENSTKEVVASDTVKATAQVRATTQPDLSARPIVIEGDAATWTGDGVIGGTDQTVSVVAIAGTSRSYELRIKNAGTVSNSFVLRMQATQTGWTDKLFDSLTGTTEITTEARETTGWATPELVAGATLSLRLEVKGSMNATANYNTDFEVSSGIETDQVTIEQLQQNITGVQWSTDGDTWANVNAQTSLVMSRFETLGFRAIKALPNEEWGDDILGPGWTFHGKNYEDGEVWVAPEYATPTSSENVQLKYGGNVYANIPIKVLKDCSLSLIADHYYVVPGTAGGYSTPLSLTVSAKDEDGGLLTNQKICLKVMNAQGVLIVGKWGESVASEYIVTTNAQGQIQINWQGQGITDPVTIEVVALDSLEQPLHGKDSIAIQVGK